jgi:hypothetical protein
MGKPKREFSIDGEASDFKATPKAGKKSVRCGFCKKCAYRLRRAYKIYSKDGRIVPAVSFESHAFSRAPCHALVLPPPPYC